MCEVRSKLFANYFCVTLHLYINLFPLFYISPCEYFLLYFSSFSFFSYTLFVLLGYFSYRTLLRRRSTAFYLETPPPPLIQFTESRAGAVHCFLQLKILCYSNYLSHVRKVSISVSFCIHFCL